MTIFDVLEARLAYEAAHAVKVVEVHISPRLQMDVVKTGNSGHRIPVTGSDPQFHVEGCDWYVDPTLRGEQYRFVPEAPA